MEDRSVAHSSKFIAIKYLEGALIVLIVPIFELSIALFLQQFEMHHMQVTEK
jgi:hypothetical protein